VSTRKQGLARPPAAGVGAARSGPQIRSALALGTVVLGIDPGSVVLGYGALVIGSAGPRLHAAGLLRPGARRSQPDRLARIQVELERLLAELAPAVVVVERAFTGRNVHSALRLGEARGVVLAAAARSGAQLVEVAPAEAKRAVVGSGSADKEQVARMVLQLLGLRDPGGPRDATDALALALGHVLRADSLLGTRPTTGRSVRGT
jgi:crossover junction endodeoxyribonuclease RuvC